MGMTPWVQRIWDQVWLKYMSDDPNQLDLFDNERVPVDERIPDAETIGKMRDEFERRIKDEGFAKNVGMADIEHMEPEEFERFMRGED